MPLWAKILLLIAAVVIGLFLLDRLALWMEARGWIYWRKIKPKGGGGAAALTSFHQLIEPGVRDVIEERQEHRIDADRPDAAGRAPRGDASNALDESLQRIERGMIEGD